MYLLEEEEADNILSEIVLGEEEKIVDIEYFTPVDSLLIPSAMDSLKIDSLKVDSLRVDSLKVDSLLGITLAQEFLIPNS
jgi:hypothetical protein